MNQSNHYPAERMTPQQRLDEAASLLARGLIRLRAASIEKSANMAHKRELALGFTADQSVHTDTVNNRSTESL